MTSVARRYGGAPASFERPAASDDPSLGAPVVLMVSGGADSCALLLLAATSPLDLEDGRGPQPIARERLHVLHINHGLRGLDAAEDAEFVRDLAARQGIPATVVEADVPALAQETPGESFESVGRQVRYEAANQLANELSAQWGTPRSAARILTAHTANDRCETFFMNAIRGSGVSGLSSIPRRRNRIVRPLLDRTHQDLCDYLRMHGVVWREDATNSDTRYLRNYVRHELVPVAEKKNPRLAQTVSGACDILSDEDAYLTSIAARALREVTRRSDPGALSLDANRLAAMEVAIARRVVRAALLQVAPEARLEGRHIERILGLVAQGSGSMTAPLGVDVSVQYGLLRLASRTSAEALVGAWLEAPGTLELPGGKTLSASLVPVARGDDPVALARTYAAERGPVSVMLDAEAAGVPPEGGQLWVAGPEAGEVLCPLGMHGQSKRLSDLLAAAHIPARERGGVPVVHGGPVGPILWVAGVRADERCRVTSATKTLLVLNFHQREQAVL